MTGCCDDAATNPPTGPYRRVLAVVIVLNLAMFGVEMSAGMLSGSLALQADALDFLGDGLTYAMSLAVLGAGISVRSAAAMVKGVSLALLAAWILASAVYRVFVVGEPSALVMGAVGAAAVAANAVSALLLIRYRRGDANVRSVWLCSRNDAIGNVAVVAAGGLVALTGTAWPDLVVAAAMAAVFLHSSAQIVAQAVREWRGASAAAPDPSS